MSLIEKIKVRWKNFFKPYIIYKKDDKFIVRGTIFSDTLDHGKWIGSDGDSDSSTSWISDTYRDKYCLNDTCEKANKVIEMRKERIKELRKLMKKEKVKYAYECYTNRK